MRIADCGMNAEVRTLRRSGAHFFNRKSKIANLKSIILLTNAEGKVRIYI